MVEKEFSCIKQVVQTVQIPLPAIFISNEISGIAEILESWKRQYKKQLEGVVVNYRHYSISSSSGFIVPNRPYVYYNVKATFDLFCPKIGDIVKGKINRISNEHIGCLIEETINVTVHRTKDLHQELLPFIKLNHEILFEISYFNYDRKMIRVTGKITPKCFQLMESLFPPETFLNVVDTPDLSNNTDEGIGTCSESTDDGLLNHNLDDSNFKIPLSSDTKSKKKSSKRSKSNSESSSMDTSDVSTSDEKSKKKKKRKDKTKRDMGNDMNLSSDLVSCNAMIQNFSTFSSDKILQTFKEEEGFLADDAVKKHKKKSKESDSSSTLIGESTQSSLVLDTSIVNETSKMAKKRKRESESSFMDTSEQSTADEMPKKKKKRKDKSVLLVEKDIKKELLDIPVDSVNVELPIKQEMLSIPVGKPVSESKKKKHKDKKSKVKNEKESKKKKKSKDKDKSKKKKDKASGSVFKKDKKPKKKRINGENKKQKKSKDDSKTSEKKKKKATSKNKIVSNVTKSEIN